MIDIIRGDDRGLAEIDWLRSRHTFSFAEYYNPDMMGFGSLRVINEDWIAPARGFPTHPHRDMEIVTYMLDGSLQHKDSMGNGSVIRPGELQRMTAGTGVQHSEVNPSSSEPAHLLQIWILPEIKGLEPGYEQKMFAAEAKLNRWCLVASRDARDGSLTIHQHVDIHATNLQAGHELPFAFAPGRRGFLQVARGEVTLGDMQLVAGDAAAMQAQDSFTVRAAQDAEMLLFDMA